LKLYRRPVFGLALSGGGARGLAHIGVLKVLVREGLLPECLAGTSMGGLIAAYYAYGLTPEEIEAEALYLGRLKVMIKMIDLSNFHSLVGGDSVRKYLVEKFGEETTFADLKLPVILNAVDLVSGKEIVLSGAVVDAVRATTAVPGIFDPVELDGMILVDGGVLNNLPANHVRSLGAEVVLAVDSSVSSAALQRIRTEKKTGGPMSTFLTTDALMMAALTDAQLRESKPELIIYPQPPPEVAVMRGFTRAAEVIAAGEQAAEEALPQIHELLKPRLRWPARAAGV
jgi:NTE family protein